MTPQQQQLICRLMDRHSPLMAQLAYRKTGDRMLAEDLVQDAFLLACNKIDLVEQHCNQAGWLYDVLNKLILRELKRAYHTREIPLDTIEDFGYEKDPSGLEDILPEALTTEERELLCLRLEQELSHREIALKKGITEAACRQQLSRLYRKCRSLLSQTPDRER